MTKEIWLSVRGKRELPVEVWFEFYKEKGGTLNSIDVFYSMLGAMFASEPVIRCKDGVERQVTAISALNKIHIHYDQMFQIWIPEAEDR